MSQANEDTMSLEYLLCRSKDACEFGNNCPGGGYRCQPCLVRSLLEGTGPDFIYPLRVPKPEVLEACEAVRRILADTPKEAEYLCAELMFSARRREALSVPSKWAHSYPDDPGYDGEYQEDDEDADEDELTGTPG